MVLCGGEASNEPGGVEATYSASQSQICRHRKIPTIRNGEFEKPVI